MLSAHEISFRGIFLVMKYGIIMQLHNMARIAIIPLHVLRCEGGCRVLRNNPVIVLYTQNLSNR